MTEPATHDTPSDAGARRALAVLILASLVVGAIWGLSVYGSLADVRSWNLTGLVMITFVFVYGLLVGARAWLGARTNE
jgi:hypothetical protein